MKLEITPELKDVFVETAIMLKGGKKRLFMARVVKSLGRGGSAYAEEEFGWNRGTIRKGMSELESGIVIEDRFSDRGRKKIEEHLPNLLQDMADIVDPASQTDPTFQSTKLYTRLSAAEVKQQLMDQKNYTPEQVPSVGTISLKLNKMGYQLKTVQKSLPKKK